MITLKVILAVMVFLWAFWGAYVLVMGIYRAHLSKRLTPATWALSIPFIVLGYAMDILAQFTIASVLFWERPRFEFPYRIFKFLGRSLIIRWPSGDWLVTDRLQRYVAQGEGWRAKKATWICDNLLDVFDPTGNHC